MGGTHLGLGNFFKLVILTQGQAGRKPARGRQKVFFGDGRDGMGIIRLLV